ncbi:hypothetical protein H4R27_004233 [Coemansia aciculifera]|nr:hypothetical protein H4R27_004233 [Coemansia aciculifera]
MSIPISLDDEKDTDDKHGKKLSKPGPQIIANPSNAYLVYPTLHLFKELGIAIDEAKDMTPMVSDIHAIPKCAGIPPGSYSPNFNSLVSRLFRLAISIEGNSASLESLGMLLRQSDVDMPPNYNVFTPTSHPKLIYVSIGIRPKVLNTTAEDL